MPTNGIKYHYRKPLNKSVFECMLSLVYSYNFSLTNSSVNQHLWKHLHAVDGTDTSGCAEWIQSSERWHRHPLRRSFWKTSYPLLQGYDGRERYKVSHKTEIEQGVKKEEVFLSTHISCRCTRAQLGFHWKHVSCRAKNVKEKPKISCHTKHITWSFSFLIDPKEYLSGEAALQFYHF